MTEWRKARKSLIESRQIRLDKKKKKEDEEAPPPPPVEEVKKSSVKVAPAPETTILTPQPLSAAANDLQYINMSNGLDLADFDNDTSSPFDNMELKTINDMEELAQVWARKNVPVSFINRLNVASIFGYQLKSYWKYDIHDNKKKTSLFEIIYSFKATSLIHFCFCFVIIKRFFNTMTNNVLTPQVLQPNSQWDPPAKLENILTELTLDPVERKEDEQEEQARIEADENTENDKHSNSNQPSVPTIVQDLQRELARPIMEVIRADLLIIFKIGFNIARIILELEAVARPRESELRHGPDCVEAKQFVYAVKSVAGFIRG